MNIDLSLLSPGEFEKLSKDILEKILGQSLLTFSEGKDKGIDITTFKIGKTYVGQCKRYNCNFSRVYSVLEKEKKKLIENKIQIDKYYLFLSVSLTNENYNEIVTLFSPWITDKSQIFSKERILDLLDRNDYQDVVMKNLVLFTDSANFLRECFVDDISIDKDALLSSINDHSSLYAKTSNYYKCKEYFSKNKVIVITGNPGFGKTTISEMLIFDELCSNKNCKIVYSESRDLQVIKNNLKTITDPVLIYINDFLGSNFLEANDAYVREIENIAKAVLNRDNWKLILNSRSSIASKCQNEIEFSNKEFFLAKYVVDISQLNDSDKGEMFYKHICFYHLGDNEINSIVNQKQYWNVIKHKNFTPRNIEYITKNLPQNKPENYLKECLALLDNPSKIWGIEFEKNFNDYGKILIESIYSLSDTYIPEDVAKDCFYSMVNSILPDYDKTLDIYTQALTQVNNSYVKVINTSNGRLVSISNPSIADYLRKFFDSMYSKTLCKWIDGSIYFNQIIRIKRNYCDTEAFKNVIESGKIDQYKFYDHLEKSWLFLIYAASYGCDEKLKEEIYNGICSLSLYRYYLNNLIPIKTEDIVPKVLTEENIDKLHLDVYSANDLDILLVSILKTCSIYDSMNIFNYFKRDDLEEFARKALARYFTEDIISYDLSSDFDSIYDENMSAEELAETLKSNMIDNLSENFKYDDDFNYADTLYNDLINDIEEHLSSVDFRDDADMYIDSLNSPDNFAKSANNSYQNVQDGIKFVDMLFSEFSEK